MKKTFNVQHNLVLQEGNQESQCIQEGMCVQRTVSPLVIQRRELPSYSRPTSSPQSVSFSLLQHTPAKAMWNIPCMSITGSLHWSLLCSLNYFNFLFKTQLALRSSGFIILNSMPEREHMGHILSSAPSFTLCWLLFVTYGRVHRRRYAGHMCTLCLQPAKVNKFLEPILLWLLRDNCIQFLVLHEHCLLLSSMFFCRTVFLSLVNCHAGSPLSLTLCRQRSHLTS